MADTETVITYEAARSNAEKIADEALRERVLRGIDVVKEVLGPDWLDTIDPSELLMGSPTECVLGQAFDNHRPTQEQWMAAIPGWNYDGPYDFAAAGYWKGLAILDGDVIHDPSAYGFDAVRQTYGGYNYEALQDAWRVVLGEEGGTE